MQTNCWIIDWGLFWLLTSTRERDQGAQSMGAADEISVLGSFFSFYHEHSTSVDQTPANLNVFIPWEPGDDSIGNIRVAMLCPASVAAVCKSNAAVYGRYSGIFERPLVFMKSLDKYWNGASRKQCFAIVLMTEFYSIAQQRYESRGYWGYYLKLVVDSRKNMTTQPWHLVGKIWVPLKPVNRFQLEHAITSQQEVKAEK